MYAVEDSEHQELFSVYYWIGDVADIKYIWAYTQEEADNKGLEMGLDVFDNSNMI